MTRLIWSALTASPVVLGASLLGINSAFAAEILNLEPVPVSTGTAFSEDISKSVKWGNVNLAQRADTQVEKGQFSSLISSELSSTEEPINEISDEPLLASEAEIAAPMDEGLDASTDDSGMDAADDAMGQVTNVSELTDVSPGDWAYEALRSLVERYGCIAGYPDGTFRGNRAMTRYEFAAGLNACLQQVERLIASSTGEFVRREDLESLERMLKEFQTELATVGTRVDTLEGRVAYLEDHQFSLTTRLTGSADFGIIDAWGDRRAVPSGQQPTEDLDVNTIAPGRISLNFDSSFTGRDLLRVKLEAGNFNPFDASVTGTDMTLYDFDTRTGPTGNDIVLGTLRYQFWIGDRIEVYIAPQGLGSPDVAPQLNTVAGTISRFGQRNPIYRLSDGAGVGVNIRFTDSLLGTLTYLGNPGDFSNPGLERGVFDGQYGALAQLTFTPVDSFNIAFTYVRYYSPQPGEGINLTGNTGSGYAQTPFGDDVASSADAYGIEAQFRLNPQISFGGWVGVTKAQAETAGIIANTGTIVSEGDEAEIWNYGINMAIRDLGKEGNVLGLIFGMPPRMRGNDIVNRRDLDTSYRVEAFYRYKITDNIAITPGGFVVFNPEHNNANDTIFVGTILTSFTF